MSEDRLTWHFENWAHWQTPIASDYGEGWSNKDSSGAENYGSLNCDERLFDRLSAEWAQAVGAILAGCTPAERAAVSHKHMDAVYRSGRNDLKEKYENARVAVRIGLARRGIE